MESYDVVIIGAGASGSALAYTLAKYSTIRKIALLEKYSAPGQVNTKASNNSQTLHVGDIETNYPIEKVKQVYPAAMMIAKYAESLPVSERNTIVFPVQKMVLGVGTQEVAVLEKRFEELRTLFPNLQKLDRNGIAQVEPIVMKERKDNEPVIALFSTEGFAVDFERLSESLVQNARKSDPEMVVTFDSEVLEIKKENDRYVLRTATGNTIHARVVVVDADSYSLLFAKSLGYGTHFSLIPIAGTFYFSKKLLNGKVYTVQEPKLPFAAVHGDPDVRVPNMTRWGPTARFHPVLESYNFGTSLDYIKSSGLHRPQTWFSFFKILVDPVRLIYLLKNMLYELPLIGTLVFIHNAQKIAPSIRAKDITVANGYGGMRLQRVDTHKGELQLGEGKIIGDNIIFNMTPSPGASVALYNALRDSEEVMKFFGGKFTFDKPRMECDLVLKEQLPTTAEVSLPNGYPS